MVALNYIVPKNFHSGELFSFIAFIAAIFATLRIGSQLTPREIESPQLEVFKGIIHYKQSSESAVIKIENKSIKVIKSETGYIHIQSQGQTYKLYRYYQAAEETQKLIKSNFKDFPSNKTGRYSIRVDDNRIIIEFLYSSSYGSNPKPRSFSLNI